MDIMQALEYTTSSIQAWTLTKINNATPKYTTISLLATNWIDDGQLCYQDIDLNCVTGTSMVNLQPTPEQLIAWQDNGLTFTTYSSNGSVRVFAIGDLPTEDYTVQATVHEMIEV
jgi:hypothetical protein